VKIWIALIASSAFGGFGLWAVIAGESLEHRVKGGISLAFYAVVLAILVGNLVRWTPGVFLTSSGIDLREPFSARCMIPWEKVVWAETYEHHGKNARVPSVGLLLADADLVGVKPRIRKKLERNQSTCGFHLYCHAETVLFPIKTFAAAIQFYAQHPEARNELVDGSASVRISSAMYAASIQIAPLGA
jgi:hypothetical protein